MERVKEVQIWNGEEMEESIQQGWIPFFVREADRGNETPDTVVAMYLPDRKGYPYPYRYRSYG